VATVKEFQKIRKNAMEKVADYSDMYEKPGCRYNFTMQKIVEDDRSPMNSTLDNTMFTSPLGKCES
jgi:hypothetical protein|tara:strand:+ start:369 stop:566 length:198 start_codon:yes stop_codon:yes gene_type:complete